MRRLLHHCGLLLLVAVTTASAQTRRIDDAIGGWAWRGVGDPIVTGPQSMIVFGQDDSGRGAQAWRLNWADDTATPVALPGLPLDKDLRYSAAQSSAGLWLAGPSIALLRPDGRLLRAPLRVERPPVVVRPDGALLLFKSRENESPRQILEVRPALGGDKLLVTERALLSYDGRPNASGQTYREPDYGHEVVPLEDGRVLMFGGSRTPTLASVYDPASARMTPVAPLPHGRSLAASVRLADGRVVVAGGEHLGCYRPAAREVDVYDPKANAWTRLPRLPLPLCADAYGAWRPSIVEASDGSLVLGGGLEPELLALARDARSATGFAGSWRRVGVLPLPRIGGVLQALPAKRVVVVGGLHNPGGFGSCCERRRGVDRVALDAPAPAFGPGGLAFNGPGVARRGQRLFVAGGRRFVTTGFGQMRYGSLAELIDLKTGLATQLDTVPLVAGALDAAWVDDDRVLVKGRLAASDRGFEGDLASSMPEGSGALALYRVSSRSWTRFDVPGLERSRLLGVREGLALFLNTAGGLQTWRVGEAKPQVGPATLGGTGAARLLPDGRVVLAGDQAPSDVVSVLDPACEAATPSCPERFTGFGPVGPARFYEVVKLNDPAYHLPVRSDPGVGSVSVSHAIDLQGRVIRLSWSEPGGASPGWRVERTLGVGSARWEALPLPTAWRSETPPGRKDCDSGDSARCQVLVLPDPRDASGQASLLFLRSTVLNRDGYQANPGTTVWWFNEAKRSWQTVLEAGGQEARYARFELPLAPAAGAQRLYSIGWHLDQPVLWTE